MEKENGDITGKSGQGGIFNRILKYAGVFGSVQMLAMLVTLVLNKIKSVWLGPACYGITESMNRNTDVVKNLTNLGIQTVAVPEISRTVGADDDTLKDSILVTRSWALLTAMAGMAVCLTLAPFLSLWAFAGDAGYTVGFMLMSLAVAAAAVTGGEMAVLRGAGLMRQVALSQLFASIVSLCLSVPLYWFFKLDGIIPALVLSALGTMTVTCCYSFKAYPYSSRPFSGQVLRKGFGMIGFGVFFTAAAFLGAWAWSIIAKFLMDKGGQELTGIYSAGYMLVTYFATLLLTVNDSEYFPRLSSVAADKNKLQSTVDSQAQAMLMLSAPLVICFIIVMPLVVYVVLEYGKFHSSIALAQLAVAGVFFKSVSQPIACIVLAKSDQVTYLIQEVICYILLVICVICGFNMYGTVGIGVALALWELLYLGLVLTISRIRYGYRLAGKVVISFLIQTILVAGASALSLCEGKGTIAAGFALLAVSAAYTLVFFRKHISF